jgi:hypothetical protein
MLTLTKPYMSVTMPGNVYGTHLIYCRFTSPVFEIKKIFCMRRRASHCLLEALTACTHLLGWLLLSLALHLLYYQWKEGFRRGKSQQLPDSSLICDWCLTGSARDEGRQFRGGS